MLLQVGTYLLTKSTGVELFVLFEDEVELLLATAEKKNVKSFILSHLNHFIILCADNPS